MAILRYRPARVFVAACVLALIALPGVVKSAGPDEKTRFDYAMSLYSQGAYDSAVKEMTEFVKDFPKGRYSDDSYYWLGKHFMAEGKSKDALDQYRIILALIPDGDMAPSAQFELASYWYNPSNPGRDLEKAIAEFMKIPFFYPDCPLADDAEYYAAICQLEKGNYAEAVAGLSAFMEKYPSSEFAAPAGYRLGMAYLLDGKTADALSALQSVRDAHPAGLYAEDALMAAELALRARDRSPLSLVSTQGEKGGAPGMYNKPQGVALGPEGRLYVADTANGRVQAFVFRDGKLELATSSLSPATLEKEDRMDEPSGVAVGPRGRVYVTDSGHNRVQVFETDGRLALAFGKKGEGDGELRSPSGITVDAGGFSFVADTGNRRVVMFDPSGRFVRNIGAPQPGSVGALKSPAGVAVDIRGNVLVTDNSADTVYSYSRKGDLVAVMATSKDAGISLKDPYGIAVDIAGNVYVADAGRRSVVVLDRDLNPLTEFPGGDAKSPLDAPAGTAVSGSGSVFVADRGNSRVAVLK